MAEKSKRDYWAEGKYMESPEYKKKWEEAYAKMSPLDKKFLKITAEQRRVAFGLPDIDPEIAKQDAEYNKKKKKK